MRDPLIPKVIDLLNAITKDFHVATHHLLRPKPYDLAGLRHCQPQIDF